LKSPYLGTIVRGGIEGIQMAPEKWTRQLTELFQVPGQTFGKEGRLDESHLRKIAQPEKLPGFFRFLYPIFQALKLGNSYWDGMLKQNNAFEKRCDRPYE